MAFRSLTRRLALSLPRVRRFYEHAGELRKQRDKLVRQLVSAEKEHYELELQHYVLRSDFQRAVTINEQLRTSLQEAEQLADELRTRNEALTAEINRKPTESAQRGLEVQASNQRLYPRDGNKG